MLPMTAAATAPCLMAPGCPSFCIAGCCGGIIPSCPAAWLGPPAIVTDAAPAAPLVEALADDAVVPIYCYCTEPEEMPAIYFFWMLPGTGLMRGPTK